MPTVTFRTLYVLFFIAHDRRELVHIRVTAHPTAAWVWRQLIEAMAWGREPKYLLRDRDAVYGRDFPKRAEAQGIRTVLTPFRAPRANAIAERVIRTLRTECLDHVLVLNERHLGRVLAEYVAYYNAARPHRSLGLAPPLPTARGPSRPTGRAVARSVLGGLHHVYTRAGLRRTDFSRPTTAGTASRPPTCATCSPSVTWTSPPAPCWPGFISSVHCWPPRAGGTPSRSAVGAQKSMRDQAARS